jgi:hypothetical protein
MIEVYDPDKVEQQVNQAQGVTTAPKAFTSKPGHVSGEVKPIDENTMISLDETPDELPKGPPIPNGTYDVTIESLKGHHSKAGNYTLYFTFRVYNHPTLNDRVIWWNIVPGTEFGEVRFKQLLSRSLTTNQKGMDVTLLERAGAINYGNFVNSGVAIGARTKLTTKQKAGVYEGEPVININITDVALPSSNSFM